MTPVSNTFVQLTKHSCIATFKAWTYVHDIGGVWQFFKSIFPNRSVAVKSSIASIFTSIQCVACLQIMYFDILVDIFVCQIRA